MKVQPVYDKILVEVESEWKSEVKTKSGIVGIVFENDVDRSVGAIRCGRIVAVPRAISKQHYILKDVKEEVKVNDFAYFHFNAITTDSKVDIKIHGKPYYLVGLEDLFCIVRDGQIIMYASRVLAEPLYDEDLIDVGLWGKARKSSSGIITEIHVGHNHKKARLVHIGNPLNGHKELNVRPGDIIYYDKDADFENEVEGKKYFCMIQEDIQMKEAA